MSDNQMVKIVFDFDLGNVPASAKKFSQYLKDINVNLDFTKNSVKQLGDAVDQTAQKMNNANSSLKKSNQQWTNLALVIQDLPYGFRGIQNNLPALLGGIAGVTGPLYLAFSAIIAGLTMFDQSLQGANKTAEDAYKKFNDVRTETEALSTVFSAVRLGTLDAKDATDLYNKQLGDLFGIAKNVYEAESLYIAKTGAYVKAQYLRAKADIELEKAKKALADGDKAGAEDQIGILGRLAQATASFLQTGGINGVAGFWKAGVDYAKNSTSLQTELVGYELDKQNALYGKALAKRTQYLSDAYKIEKQAGIKSNPEKDKKGTLNQDTSVLNRLKAEQQLYKDDMFMKRAIGLEILNEEEKLSLQKAKFEGASNTELLNIAQEFKFKRLAIEKETKDGIQEINNVYADERAKAQAKADKEAFDLAKAAKNRELQNALDAIKIESDTRQKFHKKDRAQLEQDLNDEKDALMELAATGIYTAEQFDKILDALRRVDAAIAGNKAHLKDFSVDWIDTMNNINGVIMDFINNSIYALADSLGKVLAGDTVDMVSVFGNLIADALQAIGKQLIAFATAWLFTFALMANPNPVSAGLALAAGIAAVAIGSLIKSSINKKPQASPPKFANGGIVSGPTYGLMGEYPGAKSNPEVVAPLDKLKSMIGGGGSGEFVLRGNDLVLALQRSNSSLTLRR
jgi:hypothetical protein